MIVDGNTLKCDYFGCRINALMATPVTDTRPVPRSELRLHFSQRGWTSREVDDWSGDHIDYCPVHTVKRI